MNDYKEITTYNNVDGSTVDLEGRVATSGNYYTLRIDDVDGLHPVDITSTEARILIDELESFIE
jgi:hypothetical protein